MSRDPNPIDRRAKLSEAETEAERSEAKLDEERKGRERQAKELERRLANLRIDATKLAEAGAASETLRAVQDRWEKPPLPTLDLDSDREHILKLREEVLRRRRAFLEDYTKRLRAYSDDLARLSSVAGEDERSLKRVREELAAAKARAARPAPAPAVPKPTGKRGPPLLRTVLDADSESNLFTGFSTDLRSGGVFVASVERVSLGAPVEVRCTLPGDRRIRFAGNVRFTREENARTPEVFPGLGVAFGELGEAEWILLREYAALRPPLFFPL